MMKEYIMRRNSLLALLLLLCNSAFSQGEEFLQVVSKVSGDNAIITLSSAGIAEDKNRVYENAVKSAFYTLFYKGVAGVNEGKPLVECENKLYTGTFFGSQYKCQYYLSSQAQANVRPQKTNGLFRAVYNVTIDYARLLGDMRQNEVYDCAKSPIVLPTIMTIPYVQQGESFKRIFQNNPDLRVAVSKIQEGFISRDVRTMDFESRLKAVVNMNEFEDNAGVAESNDRQMLLAEGTDVYVEVDMNKETMGTGTSVKFILKAYRTESGEVLATKSKSFASKNNYNVDYYCEAMVEDMLPEFLDDICKEFGIGDGKGSGQQASSVAMRFAIDGASATTMNSRFGPKNYALRDIIRQWVRKNAHNADFSTPKIVAEEIIYDYVMMPPFDEDGIRMDAAQFAFLLESHLKEEMGVDCTSRVIGNKILFTIY